jgi:hypothetical protein
MREDLVASPVGPGASRAQRAVAAETVLDLAPRLPVRDAETLVAHHCRG